MIFDFRIKYLLAVYLNECFACDVSQVFISEDVQLVERVEMLLFSR